MKYTMVGCTRVSGGGCIIDLSFGNFDPFNETATHLLVEDGVTAKQLLQCWAEYLTSTDTNTRYPVIELSVAVPVAV